MARYFFDLSQGDQTLGDDLGTVCANDENAVVCAWRSLAACIADPTAILPWQHANMCVRREDGSEVARIGVTIRVETLNADMFVALTQPEKVNGG